jgi:flagellar biosynthesis anti-sigma factor FlgM
MKVNNSGVKPSDIGIAREVGTDKSSIKKGPSSVFAKETEGLGGAAKVNVSERAQMMQKAKDIAAKSDVNEAKVAQLQKLIDQGEYKVDASAIADKMIDEQLATGE